MHQPTVESYQAIDGTEVAIPPIPVLPDGPMPVFGDADMEWLGKLIAARDRIIAGEDRPPANANGLPSTMDPAMRMLARGMVAAQNAEQAARDKATAKAAKEAAERFGADGRGFLDGLNDGSLLPRFWQNLRALFYQRIFFLEYGDCTEEKLILKALLLRFPPRVWVPLMAQVCRPVMTHQVGERMQELMDLYLTRDWADLRHLETGAAKIEDVDDLGEQTLGAILKGTFQQIALMGRMKRMTREMEDEDIEAQIAHSSELMRYLQGEELPELKDHPPEILREFLFGIDPAKKEIPGLSQSELNMYRSRAMAAVLRAVAPGPPEGHYMRLSLSTVASGFNRFNLEDLPRRIVWPYVASHMDILDRALGLADPLPVDPKFERSKAISLLRLLPKTPARYGDVLLDVALGTGSGGRSDALALLQGAQTYRQNAVAELDSRKASMREHAAALLASIGGKGAATALTTRLADETNHKVEAALLRALASLDGLSALPAIDTTRLLEEADKAATKKWKSGHEWIADLVPPGLSFASGTPVPRDVARWLLRHAAEVGSPAGSAAVDYRLAALGLKDQIALAEWALTVWVHYDTEPWADKHLPIALKKMKAGPAAQFWFSEEELNSDLSDELQAQVLHAKLWTHIRGNIQWDPYPQSGVKTQGILAIARHAPDDWIAEQVRTYLASHARRTAQQNALFELCAAKDGAATRAVLTDALAADPAKSLRKHLMALLGQEA